MLSTHLDNQIRICNHQYPKISKPSSHNILPIHNYAPQPQILQFTISAQTTRISQSNRNQLGQNATNIQYSNIHKFNTPNLNFLIQFGEKKNVPLLPTLLFQYPPNSAFNSLLTHSEFVLLSKANYQRLALVWA